MGNRGNISNIAYFKTGCCKRPDSSFPPGANTFNQNIHPDHTVFLCRLCNCRSCNLSSKWSTFSGTLKSECASTAPCYRIAALIANINYGIVKSGLYMCNTIRYILFVFSFYSSSCSSFFTKIYLPIILLPLL